VNIVRCMIDRIDLQSIGFSRLTNQRKTASAPHLLTDEISMLSIDIHNTYPASPRSLHRHHLLELNSAWKLPADDLS